MIQQDIDAYLDTLNEIESKVMITKRYLMLEFRK